MPSRRVPSRRVPNFAIKASVLEADSRSCCQDEFLKQVNSASTSFQVQILFIAVVASRTVTQARKDYKMRMKKAFFDCCELNRCITVFLSTTLSYMAIDSTSKKKGKAEAITSSPTLPASDLSQEALFLARYAKYLSCEKRMDEGEQDDARPSGWRYDGERETQ